MFYRRDPDNLTPLGASPNCIKLLFTIFSMLILFKYCLLFQDYITYDKNICFIFVLFLNQICKVRMCSTIISFANQDMFNKQEVCRSYFRPRTNHSGTNSKRMQHNYPVRLNYIDQKKHLEKIKFHSYCLIVVYQFYIKRFVVNLPALKIKWLKLILLLLY